MGNYTQAEPLFQRALAIDEKVLGKEHRDVASSLNNLASLYRDGGNYSQSEPLFQRALAIREKVLPPDHPSIAQWRTVHRDVAAAKQVRSSRSK